MTDRVSGFVVTLESNMRETVITLDDLKCRVVQGLVQYRFYPDVWVGPAEASYYLATQYPSQRKEKDTESTPAERER